MMAFGIVMGAFLALLRVIESSIGYHFDRSSVRDPRDPDRATTFTLRRAKWYDEEKNLKQVTKHYTWITIVVDRDGEDDEDFSRTAYRGGEAIKVVGKVEYPSIDFDALPKVVPAPEVALADRLEAGEEVPREEIIEALKKA